MSHAPLVERSGGHYARPYAKMRDYLDGLDVADGPVPADRRMIGANGPKMVSLAADRSAGALTYMVTPERTRWHRERLGRGPLLVPEQKVVLDADPVSARATARAHLAIYLTLPNYVGNLVKMGFDADDLTDGGSDRLVDALVAWGTPEAVARRARAHHDAGADQVALHVVTGDVGLPRQGWRELAAALT
ncbi:hypothetical protein Acsp04_61950 [Actinomadura sp. NBRC 104425]|nr:hypothetical protein Acsp04_61950 [Actinomadura sp. NBRC 104425]